MLEFKLPDMSCGHCASTVAKTCQLVDPNAKVEVDLAGKNVKIQSAEEPTEFVQALTEAGFPPAS